MYGEKDFVKFELQKEPICTYLIYIKYNKINNVKIFRD